MPRYFPKGASCTRRCVQAIGVSSRCISSFSTGGSNSNNTGNIWRVSSPSAASQRAALQLPTLPKNILVIRHGESLGNQDEAMFSTTPDWKIPLSEKGWQQAQRAGRHIEQLIGTDDPILFYVSPYLRTKQTMKELRLKNPVLYTREEPRLREQDFGNFQDPLLIKEAKLERPKFGRFFFRFPNGGESGADVFDRVSAFSGTFLRDMEQLGPDHARDATAIFVTHGITSRLFIMKWFHWSVDDFEALHNPPNCGLLHLERTPNGYKLTEESRKLIKGPLPQDETGVGRGLQLGDVLKERRRVRGLSPEDREAFDSLADSAWGI
jgi:broad specificity phosphatase PhoE